MFEKRKIRQKYGETMVRFWQEYRVLPEPRDRVWYKINPVFIMHRVHSIIENAERNNRDKRLDLGLEYREEHIEQPSSECPIVSYMIKHDLTTIVSEKYDLSFLYKRPSSGKLGEYCTTISTRNGVELCASRHYDDYPAYTEVSNFEAPSDWIAIVCGVLYHKAYIVNFLELLYEKSKFYVGEKGYENMLKSICAKYADDLMYYLKNIVVPELECLDATHYYNDIVETFNEIPQVEHILLPGS